MIDDVHYLANMKKKKKTFKFTIFSLSYFCQRIPSGKTNQTFMCSF